MPHQTSSTWIDRFRALAQIDQETRELLYGLDDLLLPEEQRNLERTFLQMEKNIERIRRQSLYHLRPIQVGDNQQVAQLIRTVMTEYGAVGSGFSIEDPEVDHMFEAYQENGRKFFVIEREGRILGGAGIAPLTGGSPQTCELVKMYFYNELRGKGWGKRVGLTCLRTAAQAGYTACYLETLERMREANGLYQRLGFEKLGAPMGNTGHGGCDLFYLRSLQDFYLG
jgi:putative acetyltransferase